VLQATFVVVLQQEQFSRKWLSGQELLTSLKLTPVAPVVLDMKTGMFNEDLMQLCAYLSTYRPITANCETFTNPAGNLYCNHDGA